MPQDPGQQSSGPVPVEDGVARVAAPRPGASERSRVLGRGLRWSAAWALRLLVLGLTTYLVLELIGQLWVGLLPVILSLLVSSLLWPVAQRLRRWRVPSSLAALVALLLGVGVLVGTAAIAVPQIVDQAPRIAQSAAQGLRQVQEWLQGPPLNLEGAQISSAMEAAQQRIQESGEAIASGAFSTVAAVGSFFVTLVIVLVLTFFMLKDGDRFLPWLRRWAGPEAGEHLSAALSRVWQALSGYLRAQALVSLIDAVGIGVGLLVLGVPLATPLALITFVAGFVPIVGAVLAGTLAVLVALVTNGPTDALLVMALVLVVQQLEGNVLSPLLQGKVMRLHPAVIVLAVAAGGSWFGIVGAFLAVPAAASLAAVLRYVDEQVVRRSGEDRPAPSDDQASVDAPAREPRPETTGDPEATGDPGRD